MPDFLALIFSFFDRHLTREDVRKFVLSEYEKLFKSEGKPVSSEFLRTRYLLGKLHWLDADGKSGEKLTYSPEDVRAAVSWSKDLPQRHTIIQGVVAPGTGKFLDILDSQPSNKIFTHEETERLLKHVETRREHSLGEFKANLNTARRFNEKLDISILFSRHASRSNDLRFLNAVFKLNEWLLRDYRKIQDDDLRKKFLLAMVEQENAAGELMS